MTTYSPEEKNSSPFIRAFFLYASKTRWWRRGRLGMLFQFHDHPSVSKASRQEMARYDSWNAEKMPTSLRLTRPAPPAIWRQTFGPVNARQNIQRDPQREEVRAVSPTTPSALAAMGRQDHAMPPAAINTIERNRQHGKLLLRAQPHHSSA